MKMLPAYRVSAASVTWIMYAGNIQRFWILCPVYNLLNQLTEKRVGNHCASSQKYVGLWIVGAH